MHLQLSSRNLDPLASGRLDWYRAHICIKVRQFRSTSLWEARLHIAVPRKELYLFRSTSLWEARHKTLVYFENKFKFRSTSLWEARPGSVGQVLAAIKI